MMNHNMLTGTLCRLLLILAQTAALIAFSTVTSYSQPFVGDDQWNWNQKGENTTNNIRTGYQNLFIEGFRYGIFIPTDYNPQIRYHLIVYLHGYSDTTSWNFGWFSQASQLVEVTLPAIGQSWTGRSSSAAWLSSPVQLSAPA